MGKLIVYCDKDMPNRIFLKGRVLSDGLDLDITFFDAYSPDSPPKWDTGRLFWMTSSRRTIFANEDTIDTNQAHTSDSYYVIFDENFKDVEFVCGEDVFIEGEIYAMYVRDGHCPLCGERASGFYQPVIVVRKIHSDCDIHRMAHGEIARDLSIEDIGHIYQFCADWHNFIRFDSLDIGECLRKDDDGTELRNINNKKSYSVFSRIMLDKMIASKYDKNEEIVGRVAMIPVSTGYNFCPSCGFKYGLCLNKVCIFVDHLVDYHL